MNTLAERLRHAMQSATPKKVKGVDLAAAVGVKPPSVSDWLSGKSKTMEGENLLKASKYLNVNPTWLASGVGEMRLKSVTTAEDPSLAELLQKIQMLRAEGRLNEDTIKLLNSTLDVVTKSQENQESVIAGQSPAIKKLA